MQNPVPFLGKTVGTTHATVYEANGGAPVWPTSLVLSKKPVLREKMGSAWLFLTWGADRTAQYSYRPVLPPWEQEIQTRACRRLRSHDLNHDICCLLG